MKSLLLIFEDVEYERLKRVKQARSIEKDKPIRWKELMLELVK